MKVRLNFEIDDLGHLVVVPLGHRRCVSLRFSEDSVDLLLAGTEPVCLPWSGFGNVRWLMDGPTLDGWIVTHYAVGRGEVFGVGVRVSGKFDTATHDLFAGAMTQ